MKAIEQNIEKEIAQAVMEEQPMQPPAPKRKKRLTESTAAKVIAFLLMLVMTAVTAGGVLGAVFLYSTDVYVTSETAFKQELFSNIAWGDGQTLLNFLIWNSEEQVYQMNTEAADSYCAERNISYVMVQDKTGRELWYTGLAEYDSPWQFRFSYDWANPERPSAGVVENAYTVRITVPLSSVFVYDDDYALANRLAELAYALRYWIYAIIAAAALLVTVCFIFLLCAAGHHPYVDGVRPGWGTRIPLDLLTAAVALGLILCINTGDIEEIDHLTIRISVLLAVFRVIRAIFVPFFRRNNFQSCAGTRCDPTRITITAGSNNLLITGNIFLTQSIIFLLRLFALCRIFTIFKRLFCYLKLCLFRHAQVVILNNNSFRRRLLR